MSLFRFVLALLAFVCACAKVVAVELPADGRLELAGHLELLNNYQGGFTVDQVVSGAAGSFEPIPGHSVNGIGNDREIWLRFTLQSGAHSAQQWRLRILPPILESIDFYIPYANGWKELQGGSRLPTSQRLLPDRTTVFPIEIPQESSRTFYLKIKHNQLLNAYLVLYSEQALGTLQAREAMLLGVYFGGFVLLALINLLNAISLREWFYFELSLYLWTRVAYFSSFNGLIAQYILPDSPSLVNDLGRFFIGILVASLAPLVVRIFDLPNHYPRLARFCYGMGGLALLLAASTWLGQITAVSGLLVLIYSLLLLIALCLSVVRLRRARVADWILFLSMLVLVAGHTLFVLASLGIHTGLVADLYGNQIASLAIAVMLHYVVANRVLEMQNARSLSEAQAHIAAQEAKLAQQQQREQADFTAMLLHEVKTPLAEIASSADVLEHLKQDQVLEAGDRYDAIHAAVDRLNQLVELSVARDQQGLDAAYLQPSVTNLKALAQEVVSNFQGAHRNRAALSLETPQHIADIRVDRGLIRVVLVNLMDNAIKYAPRDGSVSVSVSEDSDLQILTVCNSGQSLEPGAGDHMFERNWRGNNVGEVKGSGLGLYLVRKIVEAHKGSVELAAEACGQTCIKVCLPKEAAL